MMVVNIVAGPGLGQSAYIFDGAATCIHRQLLPALLYLLHPCSRVLSRHSVHPWTLPLRASIGDQGVQPPPSALYRVT